MTKKNVQKSARNLSPLSLLVLAACGGEESFDAGPPVLGPGSANGFVNKGPLKNALVYADYDDPTLGDSDAVRTDADGAYTLETLNDDYTIVALTDENTIDTSSGTVLSGVTLKAPSGATVVTPTSTLMEEGGLTASQVMEVLGLPEGVDPLTFNAFGADVSEADALAVEKASQQIMSVVNAFAAAAEGAGANQSDAFEAALSSVAEVVKTKAAKLTDETASDADKTLDLSNATDLALIQAEITTAVTAVDGVDSAAFGRVANDTAIAVQNVNAKIEAVTDLSSDASKNAFSTTQVLAKQVKTATEAEVATAGSGSIDFKDSSKVDEAASNAAPTVISLSSSEISEAAGSLVVGTLSTVDDDQPDGAAFVYTIAEIAGTDFAAFEIDQEGGQLSLKEQPDYEAKASYSVTVLSTDAGGKTLSQSFSIGVTDANEAPTLTVPTGGSVTEDAAASTITGSLVGSDVENDTLTYLMPGKTAVEGSYSVTGKYGTLVLNASTGAYTYTLDNSASAVTALGASSSEVETFSVQVTDDTNTTTAQNLSFTIKGANDAPSSVALTSTSVVENSAGAVVGALSASDAEGTAVTYTVAADDDGALFEIDDANQLKLKATESADFETKSSYSVTVDATDGTATTSKVFSITVGDVNEAPTLTVPTGGSVTEDADASTITGSLVGSDPESGALTYLMPSQTVADGSYSVTGTYGTLVLNASTGAYTYTLDNSASAVQALGASSSEVETFSVQVTDGSNTPTAQELSFTIKGANDAPSAPTLDSSSIVENVAGDTVGTLSSTDAEGNDINYSIAESGDNSSFEVDGTTLKLKDSVTADREAKGAYTVTVNAGDGSDSQSSTFTITVGDTNEAPTLTVPTGGSVTEDADASTITGSLVGSDVENDTLTYLMPGKTAVDGSYSVTGTYGTLVLNASTGAYTYTFDNSASAVQALGASSSEVESFSVQVTDDTNTTTAQNLSFTIKGANDAPSSVALSSTSVVENSAGAVVGALSASDAEGSAVTYTVAADDDGALFEIDDANQLKLKATESADFETKSSYSVTVDATDGTATTSKVFSITVGDVNEAPTLTVPTGGSVTEDADASTITGSLVGSDPESGALTYLMPSQTVADGSYSVTGTYGTLVLNASTGAYTYTLDNSASAVQALGASSSEVETFSVQVTDGSNTPTAQELSFTIKGANDAPSAPTLDSSSIVENVAGDTVGTLSSTDAEGNDINYSIAESGDNSSFEVDGTTLKLKDSVTADREAKGAYTVTVNAGDGSDSQSSTFTITVGDTNEAPTLTVPTGGSVTEDADASTITGSLVGSDVENDTLTYLMPGKTAVDGSYSVTGTYGTLVLNASTGAYTYTFDNSASAVQALGASSSEVESFSVQVTDDTNTTTAQNLSFTIKGANDAPSSVALSSTSVVENSAGAVVGALSASDAEGSAVTYTVAADGDGALFEIDGSNNLKLKSSVTADFEGQSSYSVTVDATDGTATTSKVFSIDVGDVNEAPTLTVPTGGSVTEDADASTITSSLVGSDVENDTLTYLMPGKTAVDGSYSVTGTYGTLVLNASTGAYTYTLDNSASAVQALGASSSEVESFSVQVTDDTNTTTAQNLSFTIKGANDAPSSVALSSTSVVENSAGAVVGALSASDAEGSAVTYTVAADGDGALFEIDGSNNLKLKSSVTADFEGQSSYSVTVDATDGTGTTSKVFSIDVGDVNEAPTLTVPTGGSVTEDADASTITGSLVGSDVENDTLTYLMPGKTAVDGSYSVTGTYGTLVLNASTGAYTYTLDNSASAVQALGASSSETETFSVQVSDGSNTPAAQSLSFTINGANDAPTITVSGLTSLAENLVNAVAATVSSTDDGGETLTVGLSGSGRDDAKFEVVDGKLRIKTSADYETQDTYRLQLKVTDSDNTVVLKNLEFSVKDSAEDVGGKVVDGYVAGATIFQDLDNDNILDAAEPFTVTSSTGEFTLSGIIASKTASLKMISGFDIGTNAPIVTSLGVPTTASGNVIASPVGTVTSLAQANDTSVGLSTSVDRVATYFGVTETSQANLDIINDDPLLSLKSSDANVVAAARDVFEANQYVMALAHGAESLGEYTATQVDSLVQEDLVAKGYNSVPTLVGTAVSTYQKIGADAFLDIVSDRIVAPDAVTTENAFQLGNAEVVWNDYDPDTGVTVQNRAQSSTTSGQLALSNTADLNLQNLLNAANESGEYNTPTLSFALDKIPTGSGSGTITFKIVDGSDAVHDDNERYIELEVAVDWEGTGDSAQITVPVQDAVGHYISPSLGLVEFTIANLDSDTISVASGGVNYPSTLDVKFANLINKLEDVGSKSLLKVGGFNLTVETTLPLADSSASTITSINTNVNIVDGSPVTAFISDAAAHEGDNTPTAVVQLNRAHSEDITLNYTIAAKSGDTASAGSDFTATTGTVTILAGLTSETITLPVLNDNEIESDESFSVTLSGMSYGSISRDTASVTLTDSTRALGSTGELNFLATETMEKYVADITTEIVAKYNAYSIDNSLGWSIDGDAIKGYIDGYVPGLKVIVGTFYDLVAAEVVSAAANTDVEQFASNLMIANAATKLFDPISYLGVQVNGDGSYVSGQSLSTLQSAISADYATFISLSTDTIGDVFGEDTAANFANATVSILSTGNDTETMSSASEIIATFDGVDTINAGGGNDKVIGGKDVDTFYGEAGNDHLYGYSGNDVLDGGAGNDKIVGGLGDDQISGGAGDDYVLAQTGDDTISTGTGGDEVLGGSGDDVITIDGTGDKTIDGGTGTDSLIINYAGITDIGSFVTRQRLVDDTYVFTDGSGKKISFKNIANQNDGDVWGYSSGVSISGTDYFISSDKYTPIDIWSPSISSSGSVVYSLSGVVGLIANDDSSTASFIASRTGGASSLSDIDLKIYGTSWRDNIEGSSKDDIVYGYDGNDAIHGLGGADQIDAGAGNDLVFIKAASLTEYTALDGGTGSDTLNFSNPENGGMQSFPTEASVTFSLASAGIAQNFENIVGSRYDDVLTGDSSSNIIVGNAGADTISGADGADYLYGDGSSSATYADQRAHHNGDYNLNSIGGNDDNLSGGAGNDYLEGNLGDDTLDGGTGSDTLTGGDGSDSFILRVGDGGLTEADADIITDFTDGSDVFKLDATIEFSALEISQGTGSYSSDTIIQKGSEFLAVVQNTNASTLNYYDFVSSSTDNLALSGTSEDDILLGASGNDTASSGTGSDIIVTHGGDDVITIDGTGDKTIDGGTGTDSLIINYAGITDIGSFVTRQRLVDDTYVFTDGSGKKISFKNIANQNDGDVWGYSSGVSISGTDYFISSDKYTPVDIWSPSISSSGSVVYSLSGVVGLIANDDSSTASFIASRTGGASSLSDIDLKIYGTSWRDNIEGSSKDDIVYGYDGNDAIHGLGGADQIDAGAGNDLVFIKAASLTEYTALDGGTGSDTLNFSNPENGGMQSFPTEASVTFSLASAGIAQNFENIVGSRYDDVLTGDSSSNIIVGNAGADTISGADGADYLYGDGSSSATYADQRAHHNGDYNLNSIGGNDDNLSGGAGNDYLEGNLGDDTLDGGTGSDTLTGGDGSDSFILRVGDGGLTEADADIITDFTDGSDVFKLDATIEFSALEISQGTGSYSSDTIIQKGSEFLAVVQNTNASTLNYYDFVSSSTDNLALSGTSEDDILLGASGNDTASSGTGSDIIVTHGGDDVITIDGTGDKTIDGGTGTDSLIINYAGITDIGSFVTRQRLVDDTYVFTDGSGKKISFKNIANQNDGDVWGYSSGVSISGTDYFISSDKYTPVDIWSPSISSSGSVVYSLSGVVGLIANDDSSTASFIASRTGGASSLSDIDLKIYGTSWRDNIEGSSKDDIVYGYDGNDAIHGLGGADQIDAGAGNDLVFIKAASLTEYTALDGGTGSDTLNFSNPENGGMQSFPTEASVTFSLASAGIAQNFENIVGSRYDDVLTGDSSSNIIVGNAGADTISGADGADYLYGDGSSSATYADQRAHHNGDYNLNSIGGNDDNLSGGAGNDYLEGNLGDDTLDGGTGSDTITTGSGSDQIILRIGDGGSELSDADIITDFTDGSDDFGFTTGLTAGEISWAQGSGDYANDTIISAGSEYLAILQGIDADLISDADFEPLDFA